MGRQMRVLFVDDQPNVLAGLRRMLRGLRDEWHMEFADDGNEALALMALSPFDVVVTDMRMPVMDGAELLTQVMALYPATVRIILSGQADQTSILRAVTPAHQYLSKPCDAELLKKTVARACALRDTLNQEPLKRLVSQVTTLPSLPHVYTQLVGALKSEEATIGDIAELITQDVGMTAKLMQMVNSSFFGMPRRIHSPAQAVALLGLNNLRPLVLSAGVFSQLRASGLKTYSVDMLIEHSLAVSRLAEEIAQCHSDSKEMAEDSMLGGLLHDVGQLLLLANIPNEYEKTLALARREKLPLYNAEFECFCAHHADVGAYLLGLWGMPDSVVEAVAFHHDPVRCEGECFSALTAVHVANALVNQGHNASQITLDTDLDVDYLQRVGVADQVPQWREMAEQSLAAGVT